MNYKKDFLKKDKKIEILSGGRSGGKSFFLNELKKYHEYEKKKVPLEDREYYIGPENKSLIKDYENMLKNYEKREKERYEILMSAYKPNLSFDTIWFEEPIQMEKKDYKKLEEDFFKDKGIIGNDFKGFCLGIFKEDNMEDKNDIDKIIKERDEWYQKYIDERDSKNDLMKENMQLKEQIEDSGFKNSHLVNGIQLLEMIKYNTFESGDKIIAYISKDQIYEYSAYHKNFINEKTGKELSVTDYIFWTFEIVKK